MQCPFGHSVPPRSVADASCHLRREHGITERDIARLTGTVDQRTARFIATLDALGAPRVAGSHKGT